MPARLSLLFSATTKVTNSSAAVPHSGGWSETHWSATLAGITPENIHALAVRRSWLMGDLVTITGYRIQDFLTAGNKLIPQSTSNGRLLIPGIPGDGFNLPSDGISIYFTSLGEPNVSRHVVRGVPDKYIENGEYAPSQNYTVRMETYIDRLVRDGWKFVGRDRTGPNARVNSIVGGVATLNGPVGGVAGSSYLRLNRVTGDNGRPIIGTFLITSIAGNNYTCNGLAAKLLTAPSGSARIDLIRVLPYTAGTVGRAVSRKIGRPFEQYRGRISKRG